MASDPITRGRKMKIAVAALVVGVAISALVALALIYMAQPHPSPY